MKNYLSLLRYGPLPKLLASDNKAIEFFVQRDLLDKENDVKQIWQLNEPQKIVNRQQAAGFWKYPGENSKIRSRQNYKQLETYRNLGILTEKYGFDRRHIAIQKAGEFMLSFQSKEGDLRGIYGSQYSPNYTAAIMELLIKAGFEKDYRIEKGFQWLLSIRQNDGGWAIPLRTVGAKFDVKTMNSATITPDKDKPFSHLVTGIVLRAFAAHKKYRKCREAKRAGELLISKLFKKDNYLDRGTVDYWLKFSFPFWFTDLLSALDSLSLLDFSTREPQIQKAVNWFVKRQQPDGLWKLKMLRDKDKDLKLWLSFVICRTLKRFKQDIRIC